MRKLTFFNTTTYVFFSLNFGLWMALFWLVSKIDEQDTSHNEYTTKTIVITIAAGLGGFAITMILHFCMPEKRFKGLGGDFLPWLSVLFLEVVSVICVVVYFYCSGFKDYFKPKWDFSASITTSQDPPGFTLFGNYTDAVSASLTDDLRVCHFPNYTIDCASFNEVRDGTSDTYGPAAYITFNPDNATNVKFSKAVDELLLQVSVQWDSSIIVQNYNPGRGYAESTIFNPTLYSTLYDSRMTYDDLQSAFRCGILGWTEQPALGSTTYTIEETTTTSDSRGMYKLNTTVPQDCQLLYDKLFTLPGGYRTYSYRLSSPGVTSGTADYCDVNGTTDNFNYCISQVLIRYGSFRQTAIESKSGIEQKDILLNVAAITGGVAYVAAFLAIWGFYKADDDDGGGNQAQPLQDDGGPVRRTQSWFANPVTSNNQELQDGPRSRAESRVGLLENEDEAGPSAQDTRGRRSLAPSYGTNRL